MKYKFTGLVHDGYIIASKRRDGTRNYINLHDVPSLTDYENFRSLYKDKTITVELAFKNSRPRIDRGIIGNFVRDIETMKVIDYEV